MDSGNICVAANNLDIALSIMSDLKYDAIGLGGADVRLGSDFYKKAAADKLTILDSSPVADKTTVPYVVKNVGGVRVGIISFGAMPADQVVDDFQLRKVRYAALKAVRSECDVLILLDQANVVNQEWLDRNSARFGAPDIVVSGVEKSGMMTEQVIGKTHIVPTSYQAKDLGIADIEVVPGEEPKIVVQKVPLDDKFAEDVNIGQKVDKATLATIAGGDLAPAPEAQRSMQSPYYSPRLCRACHLQQYEDWSKTKHAKALKTLVDAKSTTPECLQCHSEAYRDMQRYTPSSDPTASGVECQTCHMNALPHGMERREMAQKSTVSPQICLSCHTHDRSPKYNEKTYFPQVAHAGVKPTNTASVSTASK